MRIWREQIESVGLEQSTAEVVSSLAKRACVEK
jgi:hypothetical protein